MANLSAAIFSEGRWYASAQKFADLRESMRSVRSTSTIWVSEKVSRSQHVNERCAARDYLLAAALPGCNTTCRSSAVFTTWKNLLSAG